MDYRLDLFNAIKNYEENLGDDDALMVISLNQSDGDLFVSLHGETNYFSLVACNGGLIDTSDPEDDATVKRLQDIFLNGAANILIRDKAKMKKFLKLIKPYK